MDYTTEPEHVRFTLDGFKTPAGKLGVWRSQFRGVSQSVDPGAYANASSNTSFLVREGDAALVGGGLPALTVLTVGMNGLGDAGFGALAGALGRGACPGMATLHAFRNGLTVLPEALCGVASLEELNLGNSDIGSLPHGLLHLARLRRLHISGNDRLAAEHEAMGGYFLEVGALFAHLRSVHGGEPPPLEGLPPEPEPQPEEPQPTAAALATATVTATGGNSTPIYIQHQQHPIKASDSNQQQPTAINRG